HTALTDRTQLKTLVTSPGVEL
ncbi:MAG: hypothetical protein QOF38_1156, partial [Pseudonocardiales bacterium]|nr:hypothetical protein [Pseudonocardiales bacterium]